MASTLFWQERDRVPQDENSVRSTVTTVVPDAPPSVEEERPQFNAFDSDPDTQGGLTTRQMASYRAPSVRTPHPAESTANVDYSAPIDNQISTAGRAPSLEAAGVWGHGSANWQDATEPTIRPGAQFGADYFAAHARHAQHGIGAYMQPSRNPDDLSAMAQAQAANNSRRAAQEAIYDQFHAARQR
ncbi:MAG TPA: hypothetical protein VIY48_02455 [Candidatus Paceibacterota bacterium]